MPCFPGPRAGATATAGAGARALQPSMVPAQQEEVVVKSNLWGALHPFLRRAPAVACQGCPLLAGRRCLTAWQPTGMVIELATLVCGLCMHLVAWL